MNQKNYTYRAVPAYAEAKAQLLVSESLINIGKNTR